jgi:amino-acid N-acetyltransferase
MSAVPAVAVPLLERRSNETRTTVAVRRRRPVAVTIRAATAADVEAVHELITANLSEGHLLPRRRDEIAAHIHRFVVATHRRKVVACADLAPLSRGVAEVRSLIVSEHARFGGIGRRLLDELIARASTAGFDKVCAFTHSPSYFVQMGFSIVPHVWLPEKIATDCSTCAQFRQCGQYAVMLPLARTYRSDVPLTSLHG